MNCIAVIPARAGSKRIVNKNIYEILGKPAISYAILNAISSGLFKKVYVSTDSPQIAAIAEFYGATVGFPRNQSLSGDHATTIDVISGFIHSDLDPQHYPDFICCIYPVTPLLTLDRLQEGFKLASKYPSDFILAAIPSNSHSERNFSVNNDLQTIFEHRDKVDYRTQDLGQFFQDAGQFYWGTTHSWLSKKSILGSSCRTVKLTKYEVIDVDDIEDMKLVELLLKAKTGD